jgi:hypothetical protein
VNLPFFKSYGLDNPISDLTQSDAAILDNRKPPQSIVGVRRGNRIAFPSGIPIDTSKSERFPGLYQAWSASRARFFESGVERADDKVFIERFDAAPAASQFMTKHELSAFKIDLAPAGPSAR